MAIGTSTRTCRKSPGTVLPKVWNQELESLNGLARFLLAAVCVRKDYSAWCKFQKDPMKCILGRALELEIRARLVLCIVPISPLRRFQLDPESPFTTLRDSNTLLSSPEID